MRFPLFCLAGADLGWGALSVVSIVASLMFFAAVFAVWANIFNKAGYPLWYGIWAIIPGINVIACIYFAFTTWPIERELKELKERLGPN
ncbi:MAG: hypothetical protein Q7T82_06285 [Armatimonadota bacterium]|nr:hypothetical protein [Armatimonadota bacterium]